MRYEPVHREQDGWGNGEYGAPRGDRKHKGIDYAVGVHPLVEGVVTKIGYPYGDDLFFRYVEVTDEKDYRWRYFYLEPKVSVGDKVCQNTLIGTLQGLGGRYDKITPHVHLEVKDKNGNYFNPEEVD